jgi:hypothetical protein
LKTFLEQLGNSQIVIFYSKNGVSITEMHKMLIGFLFLSFVSWIASVVPKLL